MTDFRMWQTYLTVFRNEDIVELNSDYWTVKADVSDGWV